MMKPALKKNILIAVLCVLAVSVLAAALLLGGSNAQNPRQAVSDDGNIPASDTPSPAETSGTAAPSETEEVQYSPGKITRIYVYTTDRMLDTFVERYGEEHWDFDYRVLATTDQTTLYADDVFRLVKDNLINNTEPMDLFCVPVAYAPLFTHGELSQYVCTYEELGIDVDALLEKMDIPQHIINAGTNRDGKLVALPVDSEVNVFMYRRSVAKEVFGTDDPDKIAEIIGGGTESWDKFLEAAKTLKEHGYYIAPGCDDLSFLVDWSCPVSELLDVNPRINPKWEAFMDVAKSLYDEGCIKDTERWSEAWFQDMKGKGDKFFGIVAPVSLSDFLDENNETYGDWAICLPPFQTQAKFFTGIMVSKHAPNKDLIKPLIEWMTLDSSPNGLQYRLANGTFFESGKVNVISKAVLKANENISDFLGGQDLNPIICEAMDRLDALHDASDPGNYVNHDYISSIFMDETRAYVKGEKDKETAIADFLSRVRERWIESSVR
ncbi:ABC transporter substrate-binding protein [Thermoclostridium caenicola]|uniref:ABC-type glycerol-3-phosphate transport system, substrate-binding protein n=1 Tax=Thermoclostridium caenicola TaxID=659425 RepID=A0A1M6G7M6_9FIRM|nr:ABC transporter substrate-binding protein [Thermoclostridium caenicola]SHJ05938.1 ABC-type glycerol-3-phosphate transport system, substrate-binding protein [Thermoclostridium caenicola]